MTETKLDELDQIAFPGFKLITKNRLFKRKASGGVAALISEKVQSRVSLINNTQQDSLWLKFKGNNDQRDMVLCLIYVPPENSNYSNISIFDNIEDNFIDLKSKNEDFDICIACDLNARTANLKDYLEVSDHENEYLCNEMSLNSCDIQQSRNNDDKVVNSYGNRLLTLCKTLEIFIVNGRLGEDANRGKLTCNNVSLVDYFICSPSIFPTASDFEVLDFDPLLSDIHCAVTLTLKYKCSNPRNVDLDKDYTTSQDNSYVRRPPNKPNWKSDLTHQYQQKLNETDISGIMLALNELTGGIPPRQCTINKLVDEINSVYTSTASDLGMLKCGQTPIWNPP